MSEDPASAERFLCALLATVKPISDLRFLISTLSALFFALSSVAQAQQPKKVFRIGYIAGRTPATDADVEPIRLALRQSGYIEGQNILIEYRYTDGKSDRYPELLVDLVRLEVDLILVSGGDNLIRPAMKATKTIPLVLTGPGPTLSSLVLLKALAVQAAMLPALQTLATN